MTLTRDELLARMAADRVALAALVDQQADPEAIAEIEARIAADDAALAVFVVADLEEARAIVDRLSAGPDFVRLAEIHAALPDGNAKSVLGYVRSVTRSVEPVLAGEIAARQSMIPADQAGPDEIES